MSCGLIRAPVARSGLQPHQVHPLPHRCIPLGVASGRIGQSAGLLGPVHRAAVKLGAIGDKLAISESVETVCWKHPAKAGRLSLLGSRKDGFDWIKPAITMLARHRKWSFFV
jgi:hypothetical protein